VNTCHSTKLVVDQVKSKYCNLKASYRRIVDTSKQTGNVKQPKKPDHWDAMVAHFACRQGLSHSDVLNPIEEDDDEIESDNNTAVDAPTPKCDSGRKKSVIDRFCAVVSVAADIKVGLLGLGDLVRQALAPKSQIINETEILEVLRQTR
jgi:hypothetical protein